MKKQWLPPYGQISLAKSLWQKAFANLRKPRMAFERGMDANSVFAKAFCQRDFARTELFGRKFLMKKQIGLIGLCCLLATLTYAAPTLLPVHIDTGDQATLQRGAKLFMDYCSGCHALRYMRYNRMAKDLGMTTSSGEVDTPLLKSNLIYTHATPQDPIQISMPAADARQWFGRVPPDLSLTANERGASWIYTYLNRFYPDPKRPFGANNALVPDVAMPNVLLPMRESSDMTQQQFDQSLTDVVTFLSYVAEPEKAERQTLGWKVLLFLLIFLIVVYYLR